MFTVVIANSKGGCGKSTVSMLLAGALSQYLTTVVADSDPQGTSSLWGGLTGKFPAHVVTIDTADARAELATLAAEYQLVVVDCPPNLEALVFHAALAAADLLLIPCAPEPADQWATERMLEFVRSFFPGLLTRIVINKVPSGTALAREVLKYVEGSNWPHAKARLGLRTAYKEAAALGSSLEGIKGAGARTAREEVQALAMEVLTLLSARPTAGRFAVQEDSQAVPETKPAAERIYRGPLIAERTNWNQY